MVVISCSLSDMSQVFERLDTAGNGVISVNELEQVVQQEGLGSLQDDVVRLLQGIDIDGSNSLNYREFLAATMEASLAVPSCWFCLLCLEISRALLMAGQKGD